MNRQEGFARAIFLNASPPQALVEALAIAAVLSIGVFIATDVASDQSFLQVLVIGPLAAMYMAGRMRLFPGGLLANLQAEIAVGITFTAILAVMGSLAAIREVRIFELPNQIFLAALLAIWTAGALAFFRSLAYVWPIWVRLRRSKLRWEMTHTIMLVVMPFIVAAMLLFVVAMLSPVGITGSVPGNSPLEQFMILLPAIGVLIFLTVMAAGVMMIPAAVASYFAARRTASRLETLSHGTSGLRQGNYAIRVRIDGEDEISTVQHDFNQMAMHLEQTIHDLRGERDNVERLLQTQRDLVANVSHELRTPVATVRGYIESALNGGRSRSAHDLKHDLDIMSSEVDRLQRLIDDLFVLTRTEAGQLPLDMQPIDVAPVISRSVAAAAEGAWRTGRVEIIEEIVPGLPQANADAGRLEQIIRNLLSNAVRHTPPGGLVAVSVVHEDGHVRIDVKDTGSGIDPGHLGSIFDRFQRLDDAREADPTGAGLGLAIVRELTEAMDGTVTATSEPGAGSCFTVRLPVEVG